MTATNPTDTSSLDELREYLKGESFQIGLEDFSVRPKVHYSFLTYEAITELIALIEPLLDQREVEARIDEAEWWLAMIDSNDGEQKGLRLLQLQASLTVKQKEDK